MIRGTKRPRAKAIEIIESKAQKIDVQLNTSIHNRFDIEVVDAKTGEIKQRAQAENVICNSLWTRLLTPASYFLYIHYGTGNGTPSVSDTSLFTFLGSISVNFNYRTSVEGDSYSFDTENGIFSFRKKGVLTETDAVGASLSEIGIGYSNTANTLVTHAMLKDMNGNPITINKTSTDVINIYATVYVHYQKEGYDGIYLDPHIDRYTYGEALYYQGFFGWICGVPGLFNNSEMSSGFNGIEPSRGLYTALATTNHIGTKTYSVPNKRVTITYPRLSISMDNINGGIATIILWMYYYDSWPRTVVAPVGIINISESDMLYPIVNEPIGTGDGAITAFNTAFSFPTNATIYVNGVADPTVSVYTEPINNIERYVLPISKNSSPGHVICMNNATRFSNDTATSFLMNGTNERYFLLPYTENGVKQLSFSGSMFLSDDMETWVSISNGVDIPTNMRKYRFLKAIPASSSTSVSITPVNLGKNIVFASAPPVGAVLTASYTPLVIPKDVNHVFDLTVTIQLGEYTE